MTRKRFVKRLMSHSVSRNDANLAAEKVATERASYEDRYIYVLGEHFGITDHSLIDQLTERIIERIPVIVDTINRVVQNMISAMNSVAEAAKKIGEI